MPDPIVFPIVLLTGAGLLGRSADVIGGGPTPPSDGKWSFPVPPWRTYKPTRSQEYRAEDHHGVDIMYARRGGGDGDSMWPIGIHGTGDAARSNGTKQFFCPDSIYACAARDGVIWNTGQGGHGKYVVIDHGAPFATFYTHLSSLVFPMDISRGAGGIAIKRGQRLGVIGFSPLDAERLMHLHFEIWYRGGASSHVDPWPILATAPLPPEGGLS